MNYIDAIKAVESGKEVIYSEYTYDEKGCRLVSDGIIP